MLKKLASYRNKSFLNDCWYSYLSASAASVLFVGSKVFAGLGAHKRARDLCARSLRYGKRGAAASTFKSLLELSPYRNGDFSRGATIGGTAGRSIVVRWPEIDEKGVRKGVIVVTFTKTFSYYLLHVDLKLFSRYFYIVLEPSWSGYADADIFGFHGVVNNILIQCSEIQDRVLVGAFPETFIPVTFGASDWVDYDTFRPLNSVAKVFDSVYVANATPGKRALRYLLAIKNIVDSGRSDYRGCLVCASWGGATDEIVALAKQFNLDNNLTIRCALPTNEVVECVNSGKVNVLLSFKEGSNRSLFESMFCDVPVICMADNVGVNKHYINEQTGMLVLDSQLESALIWMAKEYRRFSPRQWALQSIAPDVTTKKMAAVIAGVEGADVSGKEFFVKVNRPEVMYFKRSPIDHALGVVKLLSLFGKDTGLSQAEIESDLLAIVEEFESGLNT